MNIWESDRRRLKGAWACPDVDEEGREMKERAGAGHMMGMRGTEEEKYKGKEDEVGPK
jgi:hypothetical protein